MTFNGVLGSIGVPGTWTFWNAFKGLPFSCSSLNIFATTISYTFFFLSFASFLSSYLLFSSFVSFFFYDSSFSTFSDILCFSFFSISCYAIFFSCFSFFVSLFLYFSLAFKALLYFYFSYSSHDFLLSSSWMRYWISNLFHRCVISFSFSSNNIIIFIYVSSLIFSRASSKEMFPPREYYWGYSWCWIRFTNPVHFRWFYRYLRIIFPSFSYTKKKLV